MAYGYVYYTGKECLICLIKIIMIIVIVDHDHLLTNAVINIVWRHGVHLT